MTERGPSALERAFEALLWRSRLVVVAAVVGSGLLAVGTVVVASVDTAHLLRRMVTYVGASGAPAERDALRAAMLSEIVKVVDTYLIAAIMVIFAMALYELFVSKINQAEGSELAARVLLIRSLDDLKHRLASLVLLILITTFFQVALKLTYDRPLDLLVLAVGIALLAGALFLGRRHRGSADDHGP
jgi:uncharacterized membrane protein YqhA